MCGIAAQFSSAGRARPLDLQAMAHRGPDAAGEWVSGDGRFWLGNRRLAILDLSPTGEQPMIDPATGNVIVANCEIYNHLALREGLGDAKWRGTSDTETLLLGYARWGHKLLDRIKGMFAFAIYDRAREELFVARDRLGIKPLYYTRDDDGFCLASEVKLLIDSASKITPAAVSAYLQWGACPEDKIIFSNVQVLPAGHAMTISGVEAQTWRYWPGRPKFESSPEQAPREIRRLLETAVEEHLLSDVPVASFLSGGVDSSIVTALAAQKVGRNLQTFSVGFEIADFDETGIAREVAERYGTKHERIQLSEEEVIQAVTEAVGHLDLPSVDAINTYIVSRAVAQRGVKVALSGLGGDELFGGYPSFRDVPRLQRLGLLPRALRKALGRRLGDLPNDAGVCELAQWRRRFFTAAMLQKAGLPNESAPLECPVELPDDFARISWAELTGYMRRMLLRDSDQMSMAVSLELRVPFLDHELVEYSLGLPAAEKQRYGGTKGLLVEACRDLLPPAVYQRPKAGFVLPMQKWMEGPLVPFVESGLREIVVRGLLPEKFVADTQEDFHAGRLHWTRLWSMVVLGHFVRRTKRLGVRMKILRCIHSLNPTIGGPLESLRQSSRVLAQRGHEVEVVSLDAPNAPWLREFPATVHALGPGRGTYGYAPRFVPWLRERHAQYDAVVVHGIWQYNSFGVWRALHNTETPYFVFPHGMLDPWFNRTYPLKHLKKLLYWPWAEYRVLREARAVLFTSEEERRLARQSFALYRCREVVVNYGTAAPDVDPIAAQEEFLEAFPTLRDKKLLLFLGRLHVKKGCEELIQAFAGLKNSPLHLVVAGPCADAEYLERLRSLTKELKCEERITFTGMLRGNSKWGAFAAAEVFILPSHQENFGIAVVEALACGTPVLVSDQVNIWREIVEDGAGLADRDDLEGTARLLERWHATSADQRAAMSASARRSFADRFEIERAVDSFLAVLKNEAGIK